MEQVEGKSPGAWGRTVELRAMFTSSFLLCSAEVSLTLKYRKICCVYIGILTDDFIWHFRDRNAVTYF